MSVKIKENAKAHIGHVRHTPHKGVSRFRLKGHQFEPAAIITKRTLAKLPKGPKGLQGAQLVSRVPFLHPLGPMGALGTPGTPGYGAERIRRTGFSKIGDLTWFWALGWVPPLDSS